MIDQSIYWTGTDTNNGVPFPTGRPGQPHFYLGRRGGERTADSMGTDIQAARKAAKTRGYWDLAGRRMAPAGSSAARWGTDQAEAFVRRVKASPYVHGTTLFLDIESGNGGWGTAEFSAARDLLNAALHQIKTSGYTPGIYLSQATWTQFFGATWTPTVPFVLWLAGTACPSTATEAMAQWDRLPSVGGQRPSIWQWSVSGGGCPTSPNQDWNITPYEGWLVADTWVPIPATEPPAGPTLAEWAALEIALQNIQRQLRIAMQPLVSANALFLEKVDAIEQELKALRTYVYGQQTGKGVSS